MVRKLVLFSVILTCLAIVPVESVQAERIWRGPTPSAPENPMYPYQRMLARKQARKATRINDYWDKQFKGYQGYSHNPHAAITSKAL